MYKDLDEFAKDMNIYYRIDINRVLEEAGYAIFTGCSLNEAVTNLKKVYEEEFIKKYTISSNELNEMRNNISILIDEGYTDEMIVEKINNFYKEKIMYKDLKDFAKDMNNKYGINEDNVLEDINSVLSDGYSLDSAVRDLENVYKEKTSSNEYSLEDANKLTAKYQNDYENKICKYNLENENAINPDTKKGNDNKNKVYLKEPPIERISDYENHNNTLLCMYCYNHTFLDIDKNISIYEEIPNGNESNLTYLTDHDNIDFYNLIKYAIVKSQKCGKCKSENVILVDKQLLEVLIEFNKLGFKTEFSCIGDKLIDYNNMYIKFTSSAMYKIIAKLYSNSYISLDDIDDIKNYEYDNERPESLYYICENPEEEFNNIIIDDDCIRLCNIKNMEQGIQALQSFINLIK